MPTVKKLDAKRRAVFPDRFAPGDVFLEEVSEDEIIYRRIRPDEEPEAELVRDGEWLLFAKPVSRERIAQAVREERDSR